MVRRASSARLDAEMGQAVTKLVFFGNEKLATGLSNTPPLVQVGLRKAGYEIEAVVTGPHELSAHEAQIAVLVAYGKIVPPSVLEQFPLGIINIHPSLLPIYRGPTPIEQAILDGASKTGVSIMRLAPDLDAGPVYEQVEVTLDGSETKQALSTKLHKIGADLVLKLLPGIISGSVKPKEQNETEPIFCSKITKSDGKIDWKKPADRLEREVRAYAGWPTSYTKLASKGVIITEAHVIPLSGEPGKAFKHEKELAVYTSENALIIDRVKPAGKREMSGQEFLAGNPLS